MTAITNTQGGRRKVAAVLAGGLVLGMGTMATQASWNDAEYASASFTAGSFNLEGAADQTTFSEHATPGSASTLSYSVPVGNLSPTDVVYAGYALRLAAGTTNDAAVTITNSATGSFDAFQYTVFRTAAAGCSAAAMSTGTVIGSTDLNSGSGDVALVKGSPATSPGATVFLCVKVTADATVPQASTSTATWTFQAVSN